MARPQALQFKRPGGRGLGDATLEDNSADGEKTEEDDLNEEAADDDMFAGGWTTRA